jgi:hypothetical protein
MLSPKLEELMKFILCIICRSSFTKDSISDACSLKCRIIQMSEKLENGCWLWKGTRAGDYGKVRWKQKTISAHRSSYLAFKGEIPPGLNVCHTCDNPICVNPEHLWLGTQKENVLDSKKKKRTCPAYVVKHGISKLKLVLELRKKKSYSQISEETEIPFSTIAWICRNAKRIKIIEEG